MEQTELNVNRLTATLFSNLRARLQQATTGYKSNQGHGWIDNDMYKNILSEHLQTMHRMTCSSRFT